LGGLRSVLIVTGSERTRRMYGEYLAWRGIDVHEVDSAAAAVRELPRFRPDALVTEDRLPDSTGLELVRAVRRSRATFDLPLILLCSDTFGLQPDEAERYGCDRILLVPLLPEALLDVLRVVVHERSLAGHARRFESRLFTRSGESVWIVRTTGVELAVAGPNAERSVYSFESEHELVAFQADYEQRLTRGGYTLKADADDRRSGGDRRRAPRSGVPDRRGVQ
jgi:CheY-like chemotaxis protein